MGFTQRFGGWRPVESERGIGRLHLASGEVVDRVSYRFEVWHQMVDGFPGPYRSEGRVDYSRPEASSPPRRAVLELADGRRMEVRLEGDGRLLAHRRPPEGAASAGGPSDPCGGGPPTESV